MQPSWYNEAKELFLQGHNYKSIGEALGVNRKQVSFWLKSNGYISKPIMKNSQSNIYRKYHFDEDFFEAIDTEDKAYWLGFLYADGYVSEKKNSIELGLKESDKEHLEKFKASLCANHKLSQTRKTVGGKEYVGYRLTLNSEKLKSDLINKGCVVRKTLRLSFPSHDIVPAHLIRHFIRGYVDADGCIVVSENKVSVEVVGTIEFLQGYIKALGLHQNKIHYINKRETASRVMYGGSHALRILNTLYTDASIYLDRKYNLVEQCLPSIV